MFPKCVRVNILPPNYRFILSPILFGVVWRQHTAMVATWELCYFRGLKASVSSVEKMPLFCSLDIQIKCIFASRADWVIKPFIKLIYALSQEHTFAEHWGRLRQPPCLGNVLRFSGQIVVRWCVAASIQLLAAPHACVFGPYSARVPQEHSETLFLVVYFWPIQPNLWKNARWEDGCSIIVCLPTADPACSHLS